MLYYTIFFPLAQEGGIRDLTVKNPLEKGAVRDIMDIV
jgi:hypothetical protein